MARKPLGNISQLSCGDHDFDEYKSSFSSHSLQDNKISLAKLTSQKRADNEIAPSLLATGASKHVGDISSMDTCTKTSISMGDSTHMIENTSAGGPSYSDTMGPMSEGIIEAAGPMEEFALNSVKV